jgi:hypothetical protein
LVEYYNSRRNCLTFDKVTTFSSIHNAAIADL